MEGCQGRVAGKYCLRRGVTVACCARSVVAGLLTVEAIADSDVLTSCASALTSTVSVVAPSRKVALTSTASCARMTMARIWATTKPDACTERLYTPGGRSTRR